jgi:hypothetical protein
MIRRIARVLVAYGSSGVAKDVIDTNMPIDTPFLKRSLGSLATVLIFVALGDTAVNKAFDVVENEILLIKKE